MALWTGSRWKQDQRDALLRDAQKIQDDAAARLQQGEVLEAPKPEVVAPPPEPVWERPAKIRPKPMSGAMQKEQVESYAAIAAEAGVCVPDMVLEQFKLFLHQSDWPVFSLTEVVAYMDQLAIGETDKERCGWEWRPLRAKDQIEGLRFGTKAERRYHNGYYEITGGHQREVRSRVEVIRGSDYYFGPHDEWHQSGDGRPSQHWRSPGSSNVYDKLVPAHALKKVIEIEKTFGDKVALFVSDYAPLPHIQFPDPFLMAVVPNPKVNEGVGRFVIDFWDEPGFGLAQQLKA